LKESHIYAGIVLDKSLTAEHNVKVQQVISAVTQVLGFLPRAAPNLTDHGVQHSKNLMDIFSNFSQNLERLDVMLSEPEKYLLTLGIWLHDVGLLITDEKDKKAHGKNSIKVMESKAFSMLHDILGKDVFNSLKYVVKYHSSDTDLKDVPQYKLMQDVRLRLVCTIFRLIDGCDITSARASRVLYNLLTENGLLNDESLKHWKAHISIVSAVFQQEKLVVDCDNESDGLFIIDHLKGELETVNQIFKEELFPEFQLLVVQSDFFD